MNFIIFDIDGTLTNTKKVDDKCFFKAFKETFDIDLFNQDWADFKDVTDLGITEEIIKREWNRKPTIGECELLISNFITNFEREKTKDISQFKEIDGAKDFFNILLKSTKFHIGIATGAWKNYAILKPESAGIKLEGVSFSNSNFHKSRENITNEVIRQLKNKSKKDPERIIYFGDGE